MLVVFLTIKIIFFLALSIISGHFLVQSTSKIAEIFQIPVYIISATIVAFGTSLPEILVAIQSLLLTQNNEIVFGNIIGSNIFNITVSYGVLLLYAKQKFDLRKFDFIYLLLTFIITVIAILNKPFLISALVVLLYIISVIYYALVIKKIDIKYLFNKDKKIFCCHHQILRWPVYILCFLVAITFSIAEDKLFSMNSAFVVIMMVIIFLLEVYNIVMNRKYYYSAYKESLNINIENSQKSIADDHINCKSHLSISRSVKYLMIFCVPLILFWFTISILKNYDIFSHSSYEFLHISQISYNWLIFALILCVIFLVGVLKKINIQPIKIVKIYKFIDRLSFIQGKFKKIFIISAIFITLFIFIAIAGKINILELVGGLLGSWVVFLVLIGTWIIDWHSWLSLDYMLGGLIIFMLFIYYHWIIRQLNKDHDGDLSMENNQNSHLNLKKNAIKRYFSNIVFCKKAAFCNIAILCVSLTSILIFSKFFVNNAVELAKIFNVSDYIIGATIIAIGTSIPELLTTFIAIIRHQTGIALGNIVGSNVINILGILGIAFFIPGFMQEGQKIINNGIIIDLTIYSISIFMIYLSCIYSKKYYKLLGFVLMSLYGMYFYLLL